MTSLEKIAELYIDFINAERKSYGYSVENLTYTTNEKAGTIDLNIPTYYYAIETGRKVLVKKIPILVIINWLKSIGRNATSSLAYAIQTSIYLKGIKPKKGFITDPLSESAEPANELLSLDFSTLLTENIKKI